jgi:atypical dual specificity phosphatase
VERFYWLVDGRLAGCSRPGGRRGDQLRSDLEFLREAGIEAILSLTETALDAALMEEMDFEWLHLPVIDLTPPSERQLVQALDFIDQQHALRRSVAVHCLAGQGRTGTVLAAWLIRSGMDPAEALAELRGCCPGAVENDAQVAALEQFAERRLWVA